MVWMMLESVFFLWQRQDIFLFSTASRLAPIHLVSDVKGLCHYLATHHRLLLLIRINGAVSPLPHTSSWCDAKLSARYLISTIKRFLFGKCEGRRLLESVYVDGRMILKWIVQNRDVDWNRFNEGRFQSQPLVNIMKLTFGFRKRWIMFPLTKQLLCSQEGPCSMEFSCRLCSCCFFHAGRT
jgi:hypothetical protein